MVTNAVFHWFLLFLHLKDIKVFCYRNNQEYVKYYVNKLIIQQFFFHEYKIPEKQPVKKFSDTFPVSYRVCDYCEFVSK